MKKYFLGGHVTSAWLNGTNGFISQFFRVWIGLRLVYGSGYWLGLGFGLGSSFGLEIRAQGLQK